MDFVGDEDEAVIPVLVTISYRDILLIKLIHFYHDRRFKKLI